MAALGDLSLCVHALMKLPWNVSGVMRVIERGAPHTLPLWFVISQASGTLSYSVKVHKQSRYSDPDATVEIVFYALHVAVFVGPW